MSILRKVLMTLMLAGMVTGSAHANLVANGDFETGDFTSWNVAPPGYCVGVGSGPVCSGVDSNPGQTGSFAAWIGPFDAVVDVSQLLLGTTTGQAYQLDFDLANTSSVDLGGFFPNSFQALWDGNQIYSISNDSLGTPPGYQHISLGGILGGASGSLLEFKAQHNPAYFVLDNVTVTAVPEPEIYAMMAAGLGLMGFVARRRKAQFAAA